MEYLGVGGERGPYSVAELAARGIGAESLVMAADGGSLATRLAGGNFDRFSASRRLRSSLNRSWTQGVNISSGPGVSGPSGPGGKAMLRVGEQVIVGERIGEGPDVVQGYAPQPSAQPERSAPFLHPLTVDPVASG